MKWIHYFSDPLPPDCDPKILLGGKGASLAEMTAAGLQVPPGFTLSTGCCQYFFRNGKTWPEGLAEEVRANLARLERDTGRTFGRGQKPLLVSVRSGAAVSMPGMMDTLLNCGLNPQLGLEHGNPPWFHQRYLAFIRMFARTVHGLGEETFAGAESIDAYFDLYHRHTGKSFPQDPWHLLVACIDAVFASWASERAETYRARHDIRNVHGTAVNVQAMWPSEVSGICFTQDPTNLTADRLVIESSYGLGEAVVSGDVNPDRFIIPRNDARRIEKILGHKVSMVSAFGADLQRDPDAPSLDDARIQELYDLSLRIEKHFDHPVDIEWGWADGRFALLQARPIRGLEVAQAVEQVRQEEVDRLRAEVNGRRRLWVAHNLGETLRAPMPLTWDIMRGFMSGSGGFGRLYQNLGYKPSRRVRQEGFLELIGGRIYADPDRLAELFWEDMPLTYDLDALALDKSILDRAPTRFDATKTDALFLFRLPRNLWAMWRASRRMRLARCSAKDRFEHQVLPPFLEYVRQKRGENLGAMSHADLLVELDARIRRVLNDFGPESLSPGFFGGMAFDAVESQLIQLMGPHEGAALAGTLILGLEGDITFEQDELLFRVAQGKADLGAFLDRFGHRCIGEMELATPRWRENSTYLEQTVTRLRAHAAHDPSEVHRQNVARRQAADAELPDRLRKWAGSSFREQIEHDLADARALLPYREAGKYYLMMGYELIRQLLQELGKRWDLGNDLYFLHLDELPRFSAALERIKERKIRWQALQRLDMPEIVDSVHLDRLGLPQKLSAASEYSATAMAPGVASGTARIVENPQEVGDLGTDYVLVCASTDPGWTPLFLNARGLIVERGGVLSHGAIVARDFGIPAVACPQATRLLHDGDLVRVDGNQGQVVILKRAAVNA